MKKCLLVFMLAFSNSTIATDEMVVYKSALLLTEILLAAKKLNKDDKKLQKNLTVAGAAVLIAGSVPILLYVAKELRDCFKTKVGVIKINGFINNANIQHWCKEITKFREDKKIKAVLLKIDCPGGTVSASSYLHHEMKALQQEKPVLALVEGVCASGAYLLASACDYIIAPQGSVIGSIGVRGATMEFEGLPDYNKLGFFGLGGKTKWHLFGAGKFKQAGSPFKEMTQEENQYIQESLNAFYLNFCKSVAEGRNLSLDTRSEWADARIFWGDQALEKNLIDEIGTMVNVKPVLKRLISKRTNRVTGEILFVKNKTFAKKINELLETFINPTFLANCVETFTSRFEKNRNQRAVTQSNIIVE